VLAAIVAALVTSAVAAGALLVGGEEATAEAMLQWSNQHLLFSTLVTWVFITPAVWVFGRWMTGLGPAAMGLHRETSVRLFLLGGALGTATLMVPALVGRACGWLIPAAANPAPTGAVAIGAMLFALPALGAAAFGEELAFRGVLLPYWQRATNGPAALLVTAAMFVAVHGLNPNASAMGWTGVFLAGLWLGVAVQVTGSLWFATGLHLGWNVATSLVLGLPVSGFDLPSLLRWETADTPMARRLLGGSFGPEEGIAFHLALTVSLVVVLALGSTVRPATAPTS
jgi:membrane protease YdiL (CAAX protease family)